MPPSPCLEKSQVTGQSIGIHESGCSTSEHCHSSQQSEDREDMTIMLQSSRIKVEQERQNEVEVKVHHQNDGSWPPGARRSNSSQQSSSMSGLTFSQRQHFGTRARLLMSDAHRLKEGALSLLSRFQGLDRSPGSLLQGVGLWLFVVICLCSFCALFFFERWSRILPRPSPAGTVPNSRASTMPQLAVQPVTRSRPGSSSASEPFVNSSSRAHLSTVHFVTPVPSSKSVPGDRVGIASRHLPPPLCPSLVLPESEARLGIPMFELAQLITEGELRIVALSGKPLLRASVCKVGRRRSLEISMPEAGSAPRATIGPNLQDLNRPDDGALEIRGLKGSFYGLLEMRNSGACYVTKDGETMMIIDGDTESLQLSIKSGGGLPLASVRCSTEPFGGVDHVEIRVEPGVDTVLVLACVLAVLLLSPSS